MPPTEQKILTTFLLPPSSLPQIISLASFTLLFPRSVQSSPAIRTLYRDLQHQRAQTIDNVSAEIEQEVRRGKAMERAIVRSRRADERVVEDDEVGIERALSSTAQISNLPSSHPHSLHSILPPLETAIEDLEDEIARIDAESEELLKEMKNTVGELSDLRYGRLANPGIREQVLEGLERVEGAAAMAGEK
ncbi:cnl2 nkp2 family protein [Botrytis cinerea]